MKVYVLYLLVATSHGPQYEALESWRTKGECLTRALAFSKHAMQTPKGNLLGATCREQRA